MNATPEQLSKAIDYLKARLSTMRLHQDVAADEIHKGVDATIAANKRSKGKRKPKLTIKAIDEQRQYKDELSEDIRAATIRGKERGLPMPVCRKLAVILDGTQSPDEYVTDAIVELDELQQAILTPNDDPDPWVNVAATDAKSRQKVWTHANDTSKEFIRKTSIKGRYEIRQSHLHEYLSPSIVRQYLGNTP